MTDEKPTIGGKCPVCGYEPLYIDGGVLVCVGCEATYGPAGEDLEETKEGD